MSYAGTYGKDETCPHGHYWRSCEFCSDIGPKPTAEDIASLRDRQALRREQYLRHPQDIQGIEIASRSVVVYDAECPSPSCGWSSKGNYSREVLERELAEHLARAEEVAADWVNFDPVRDSWRDP